MLVDFVINGSHSRHVDRCTKDVTFLPRIGDVIMFSYGPGDTDEPFKVEYILHYLNSGPDVVDVQVFIKSCRTMQKGLPF